MSRWSKFKGTGVAIVTPFKANKSIDWEGLERMIHHVSQENGVDYIVSLGTTGESITLSLEECKAVLNFTKKVNNGKLPLVAGLFGSNDTASGIERFSAYQQELEGYEAVLSSSPNYNRPSQEGIYQHYMQIADASPLPIIIYNVPSRTGSNVSAKTTLRLAHGHEKFMATKEASGNLVQCMEILKDKPIDFLVLSGDDPITLPLIGAGGQGVISVIANGFPVEFSTMVREALKGNFTEAQRLNNLTLAVHPWLYIENNPAGIKACLHQLGIIENELRLPLVPQVGTNYDELKKEVDKVVAKSGNGR
ncbi:MAG: 4-hydroxy-tetrahydrodipicolinate synthase [Saprospiraceae bacterium]